MAREIREEVCLGAWGRRKEVVSTGGVGGGKEGLVQHIETPDFRYVEGQPRGL